VRADPDQPPQPAGQRAELGDLLADRGELGLSRARDVLRRPGLRRAEQVADLGQREAEQAGPADERQPPLVGF
jgi:hypothetical protein